MKEGKNNGTIRIEEVLKIPNFDAKNLRIPKNGKVNKTLNELIRLFFQGLVDPEYPSPENFPDSMLNKLGFIQRKDKDGITFRIHKDTKPVVAFLLYSQKFYSQVSTLGESFSEVSLTKKELESAIQVFSLAVELEKKRRKNPVVDCSVPILMKHLIFY